MAQQTVTYESVMHDLKERKFKPIYYLMGDEPYFIDKISDWIADNVLQPEERDFNQTVLFGSDVNASQIADAARRYPMMAERQVVIVKEAQNIKNTEPIERYLKNPMASTVLVMCHKNGTIDGRRREYVKTIQQTGVLFESKKLRERDLPSFIERYLKAKNATIEPKAIQMIADSIGADLSRLTGEMDKVGGFRPLILCHDPGHFRPARFYPGCFDLVRLHTGYFRLVLSDKRRPSALRSR